MNYIKAVTKFLGVATIFVLGFMVHKFFFQPNLKAPQPAVRQGGYKFTNPLLECDLAENSFTELKPFKDKLVDYIEQQKADGQPDAVAVYFRDLNNGPWFGYNENEKFAPGSLFKVPVMFAYLKLSESNPYFLQNPIIPTQEDLNVQNDPSLKDLLPLEAGKTYTAEELIRRMIIYSDNVSAELLIGHIDPQVLKNIYSDFGIDIDKIMAGKPEISVRKFAGFFRVLFNASYLNRQNSEWALDLLSQTAYKDGLLQGLTPGILLSHKYGIKQIDPQNKQLHDCGIVYYPKHPYLLCVMSKGQDFSDLNGVIKGVSSLVYNEINNQFETK
jgi:beta-lactamase class A